MVREGAGRIRGAIAAAVALLTVGALVGGGYLAWTLLTDIAEPDEDEVAEAADRVERALPAADREEAREAVARGHDQLNEHLAYGGIERLDIAAFEERVGAPMREELAAIAAAVDDTELRTDLEAVVALLEFGAQRDDPEALKLAHRVLHDLDYFAFNPDAEGRYWGATVMLEGEDNPAQAYLSDHDS